MKPAIHPKASKLVVRVLRQVHRETHEWSYREVARRLDVNVKYVWQNITKGIEPPMPNIRDNKPVSDADAARVELREKMGLPTGIKKPRSPYSGLPKYFNRTPDALAWFQHQKARAQQIADDTRAEQYKFRKPRKA